MSNPHPIYSYSDFRRYLYDYFRQAKEKNPAFSHRFFANKLGLAAANFMLLVIQGKRNITPSTCFKISEALKHNSEETAYFENMVNYGQAKALKEKDAFYNRLMMSRREMKVDVIEDSQYEYYSQWYNPVVRELVIQDDFNGNLRSIAGQLSPTISVSEVRKSIKLLLKLGMIKQKGKGFVQSAPFVSTGSEVTSLAVANFHRKMAQMAAEAIDRYKREQRNISSCTVRISGKGYKKLTEKIAAFRKDVFALVSNDADPDRVYQFNFQLFPLTKPDPWEMK